MMSKTITLMLAAGLIGAFSTAGLAQSRSEKMTPGHEMQEKGSKKGEPGASGYSPGHEMQEKGSKKGEPGASGYAPGHK